MLNTTPSKTSENTADSLSQVPSANLIIQEKQTWSWSTLFLITTLTAIATILVGNLFVSSLV